MATDYQLVFLRHGESDGNRSNVFTGWRDVDLSPDGVAEARLAGQILRREGFKFDIAYTSMLRRAIKTLWLVCEEMDLMWAPIKHDWRLNERHYGALQGMDKETAASQFGQAEVKAWRRGFADRPPLVSQDSPEWAADDPRYAELSNDELPRGESLQDVLVRSLPCWRDEIQPQLRAGRRVLVAGHGNTLRALAKYIENIDDESIVGMRLPNGVPRAYSFDSAISLLEAKFLD